MFEKGNSNQELKAAYFGASSYRNLPQILKIDSDKQAKQKISDNIGNTKK